MTAHTPGTWTVEERENVYDCPSCPLPVSLAMIAAGAAVIFASEYSLAELAGAILVIVGSGEYQIRRREHRLERGAVPGAHFAAAAAQARAALAKARGEVVKR